MFRPLLKLALFTAFSLFLAPAYAKPVTGMDEPGEGEPLRHYYWVSAMGASGTSYEAAKAYAQKAQAESQITRSHAAALPNGWKIAPAGTSLEVGTLPGEAVLYAGRLVVLNNGFYPPKQNAQVSVVDPRPMTLLGLEPFDSGDALAIPMMGIFSETPDFKPYQAPDPSKDLMDSDEKLYRQLR